ncbi:MAG: Cys-tRNA(Pro) deacylase [Eubacteriales bacterium]
MGKAAEKTNAMRMLDKAGISYVCRNYTDTGAISGADVASVLGEDPERVFKTLVTRASSGAYYVFIVPVCAELDLKKAAKAVGEKSVAMIKSRELLPLTGYIHGGCSPVGMKKRFATVLDSSAEGKETIFVSGGRIGLQIELSPEDLAKAVPLTLHGITA